MRDDLSKSDTKSLKLTLLEKPEGKDFKLKPGAGCYDYGWRHIKRHTCSSRQVCKKWERLPRSCLFLSFYLINFISFHFTFTKSKRVKVPNIRNLISRLVGHFSFSSLSYASRILFQVYGNYTCTWFQENKMDFKDERNITKMLF